MKYALLTYDNVGYSTIKNNKINIDEYPHLFENGLPAWRRAFRGDVIEFNEVYKSELEDYDVLHINICTKHVGLAKKVGQWLKNSSTKIIANMDYSAELMINMFPNLAQLEEDLEYIDFLFCQTKTQKTILDWFLHTNMNRKLKQEKVPVIPHPIDIEVCKSYRYKKKQDYIVATDHPNDNDKKLTTAMSMWSLKDFYSVDRYILNTRVNKGFYGAYEFVGRGKLKYTRYLEVLSGAKISFDLYLSWAFGRYISDCAAVGTPCISSNLTVAGKEFFPKLRVSPFDPKKANNLAKRLFNDKDFYKEVRNYAFKKVENYSLVKSKNRLLSYIKELNK